MALKIMEWNIQGSAALPWADNREIRPGIVDKVIEQDADIIVLTEFCISTGWDYFQKQMRDKYIWFMNYTSGKSGILICVKSKLVNSSVLKKTIYSENPIFVNNESCNILQISLPLHGGRTMTVVGCRVEVDISHHSVSQKDYDERGKAFNNLLIPAVKQRLSSSDIYIVCGDFNNAVCRGDLLKKFNPTVYKGHAQCNYNLNIIKDTFDNMGFIMADIDEKGGAIATFKGYVPDDHIFVRGLEPKSFESVSSGTDSADTLSDHKIIWAKIDIDI